MRRWARAPAAVKADVVGLVARTRARTGWTLRRITRRLGLSKSRYHEWVRRAAAVTPGRSHPPAAVSVAGVAPGVASVMGYAVSHPRDGYRRLAWMMVDDDVGYLNPSSVYRILDDADLLSRWKRSRPVGERPAEPTRPHQRWHTDLMYLRGGRVVFPGDGAGRL